MSWDSYIDNLIGHSKDSSGALHCDQACIIGLDASQWTSAGHASALKISPEECSNIASCMKSGDFTLFQSSGISVTGVKYQFLRGEDKLALGKKKDHGAITLQAPCSKIYWHTAPLAPPLEFENSCGRPCLKPNIYSDN